MSAKDGSTPRLTREQEARELLKNRDLTELRRRQRRFQGKHEHLERLFAALRGDNAAPWNGWRKANPTLKPDLRRAVLTGLQLGEFDLRSARLCRADLGSAHMWSMQLAGADMRGANLQQADLNYANLRGTRLDDARLCGANLTMVDARGAFFRRADLSYANLGGADLRSANLTGAHVSGTSTWDVLTDDHTRQADLRIDQWVDPLEDYVDSDNSAIENIAVRTDRIETAQLLYMLSSRGKTKIVIDALTKRVVLLLGNFSSHGKSVLLAVRGALAKRGYAPIMFDFPRPEERDLIETVSLIAGFSRFVIADLTRPKSTPLEAMLIAPQMMIPFAPIVRQGEKPFAMFGALQVKYDWILDTWFYRDKKDLLRNLETRIINPCERVSRKLVRRRFRAENELGSTTSRKSISSGTPRS